MFFDGTKIKEMRRKKNITRKELVEHVSISYNTLKNWELGKKEPYNLSIMNQIASYLDCDIREFLVEGQTLFLFQKETFTEREFELLQEAIQLVEQKETQEVMKKKLNILKRKQGNI